MEILGRNIRTIRKRWKESQVEFALRLGVLRTTLSRMENGTYNVSVAEVILLSKWTGIDVVRLAEASLKPEEIPEEPLKEADRKAESAPRVKTEVNDIDEFMDLRNLAQAVIDLQGDMQALQQMLTGLDEEGKEKLQVFKAIEILIHFLEKGMDESEYREEKEEYLKRLAAIVSGK